MLTEEHLTYQIRGAIFEVHNILGPGLLENLYVSALRDELLSRGLRVQTQMPVSAQYKNGGLQSAYRIDLLVNDSVIIEVKSVDILHDVHKKSSF